ncbi:hypothetical protein CVT24_012805 [Panaeolus cyanescens]|uniref:XRRM domain-containing protein n=1 Tax=Panaeolus cyanescens TaxID=181874 RepID=A0A409W2N4_9AGAR|nr:hypothetical protein CVT24_012805 [Panaeolus cyanescens]
MDSTLAFIPRSVNKRGPAPSSHPTGSASVSSLSKASHDGQTHLQARTTISLEQPSKQQPIPLRGHANQSEPNLRELTALVCLALSDYALWLDPDLQRTFQSERLRRENEVFEGDESEGVYSSQAGRDEGGCKSCFTSFWCDAYVSFSSDIPLSYILEHSPVFRLSNPRFSAYPPTLYVKALRAHASDLVVLRLDLSSGVEPSGRTRGSTFASSGLGYQVRRKSQSNLNYTKQDWDQRTLYMENIPPHFRTITGIIQLVSSLLPNNDNEPFTRLQNISFPSHHKDRIGDIPTCKGFALVTLLRIDDAELLAKRWCWNRHTLGDTTQGVSESHHSGSIPLSLADEGSNEVHDEARKFGLRMLSKKSWEGLKAEYLLYRQRLVEEINSFQDDSESRTHIHSGKVENAPAAFSSEDLLATGVKLDVNDPYPYGCLVFLRNVHPETNKTTLRSLFSHLLVSTSDHEHTVDGLGIDYLDYNKGMDNCFIRLKTPAHASRFVHHINSQNLYQQSGLDATGASAPIAGKPETSAASYLRAELILGTREEVYWNKVPERVRRQAVERAVSLSCSFPPAEKKQPQKERIDLPVALDMPYPSNCLVFVRNVHPETNKTTLRTLFTDLIDLLSSSRANMIDYVDFNKGMDNCYLRLSTPAYAGELVEKINSTKIVQTSGLDATGAPGNGPSIQAELVTGKREEIYWEKVPEKIRKQAVEKMAISIPASGSSEEGRVSTRKRKR